MMIPEVEKARAFAMERHGDQAYGTLPYVAHLDLVASNVRRYGLAYGSNRVVRLVAAYLHDVVEDTPTTVAEVRALFGDEVADLVWAVTNEPGSNRKERAVATYPKIRAAGRDAVALKLCDRIANVEFCRAQRDHRLRMYQKEHASFRAALYAEDDGPNVLSLWTVLDNLMESP